MSTIVSCCIDLPANFRSAGLLAFHQRDSQQIAERVDGDVLHKGVLWRGLPAQLSVALHATSVDVSLALDGVATHDDAEQVRALVQRMLGLNQPVEVFEQRYRDHSQLGPLLASQAGLRVPVAATPFEALTWGITGQQISVHAAVAVRRKFILAANARHSAGLSCYPDAHSVAQMDEASLRAAGFSQTKARTILSLSAAIVQGALRLDDWLVSASDQAPPMDELRRQLLQIRGIGPWTVSYGLLRGFGWLDGSLHGDVAVRRQLQRLLGTTDRIDEAQAQAWLAEFSPWRALVAAHLWAMPAG